MYESKGTFLIIRRLVYFTVHRNHDFCVYVLRPSVGQERCDFYETEASSLDL